MFTINIVQKFSNESVCIRKQWISKRLFSGFQISRAPPSWILIVTCHGFPIVPEQSLFVSEK